MYAQTCCLQLATYKTKQSISKGNTLQLCLLLNKGNFNTAQVHARWK